MKILKFLFQASKGVIMGAGFGFTAILAILSLSVKNGALTEAKVDLSTLTSGYWVYVWTLSLPKPRPSSLKDIKEAVKKAPPQRHEIVQVRNPKTERYVKIDVTVGEIISHKKSPNPYKNIPIVSKEN